MIVRTRHGCVPVQQSEGYAAHLQATAIQHATSITGNLGAFVRCESKDKYAHFFVATYWDDLVSIKEFVGENYEGIHEYPGDTAFELIAAPRVFHHQVNQIVPL